MEHPAPEHLLLVRHGRSEVNELQTLFEEGENQELLVALTQRHSEEHILTPEGRWHAQSAGQWLVRQLIEVEGIVPTEFFSSPLHRPMQTAGIIGTEIETRTAQAIKWHIDRLLREQQIGAKGQIEIVDHSHPLYARDLLGESTADAITRFELFMHQRKQQLAGKVGLLVVHGHLIGAAHIALEQRGHTDQAAYEAFKSRSIANCNIVHYTSVNPVTQEPTDRLQWVRGIVPYETEKGSHFAWTHIPAAPTFSSADLLDHCSQYEPLLPEWFTDRINVPQETHVS